MEDLTQTVLETQSQLARILDPPAALLDAPTPAAEDDSNSGDLARDPDLPAIRVGGVQRSGASGGVRLAAVS